MTRPAKDLRPLLEPRSVAVIGASQKGGRATGAVQNLLDLGFAGAIHPVNPNYDTVLGLRCYPSVGAIPTDVDLVAIGIPGAAALQELRAAHDKGVRAAVLFASGFAEAGEQGKALQAELAAFAADSCMLVCGPNCLGVVNLAHRSCGYSSISPKGLAVGDVGVVSQSGTVIVALVRSLRGLGFSHLISSGNEGILTSGDYVSYLATQPATKVIALFLESINDPMRFADAVASARRAGKPVVALKTGRSAEGQAASLAHTGSLAGSAAVHDAFFLRHGVVQCADLDEWIETIEIFRHARPPTSPGIGLIGVSGGENALVLDHAAELGLSVPPLSERGRQRLAEFLPWFARPENPVDPTGAAIQDPSLYVKCLEVLADEPHLGIIAVSQDCPAAFDLVAAKTTAEVARRSGKCFVYFNNFSGPFRPEVQTVLREAGVPYLQGLRESLKAIKALIAYHRDAPNETSSRTQSDEASAPRREQARAVLSASGPLVTEDKAKQLIALYGLPVVRERLARTVAEAVRAADELGYPIAAKIVSPDIAHKAQVGGVRLALRTPAEVEEAFASINARVSAAMPAARIEGVLLQPMVSEGIEIIMGLKRDPQFGMTIVFGLGGVLVEALKQTVVRLAPIDEADARSMIESVPVLRAILAKQGGGREAMEVLVPLLVRLSDLAVDLADDIEELDLNPVILQTAPARATVVDAIIVRRGLEG
jgi:acetate---CoA ligase (ADP-forming)